MITDHDSLIILTHEHIRDTAPTWEAACHKITNNYAILTLSKMQPAIHKPLCADAEMYE